LFTECWLEGHGDVALEDMWSFIELGDIMPTRKERAIQCVCGEDEGCGKDGVLATWHKPGRCLKFHLGEAVLQGDEEDSVDGMVISDLASSEA